MRKVKTTIYRCDHCNKPYITASGCKKHESYCFNNIENKACLTCINNDYGRCVIGLNPRDETSIHNTKISNTMTTNCKKWETQEYDF